MKIVYTAFCLIVIVFSSCMWGKPHKKLADIATDTLLYKYTVFKQRAADCGNKSDSDCTVVKFKYPEFKDQKTLNDTIAKRLATMFQLSDTPAHSIHEVAKTVLADYDSLKKDSGATMFYSLDAYAKVVRQDSSLAVLEIGGFSFMGGAHPSSYTGFINWNTRANKQIILSDLIDSANMPALSAIAEFIFRKNENLGSKASLAGNYFFKDDKFALNSNFMITPAGFRFLYNQYEIKPYAAGTTDLVIPYLKIKSLLRPNTVIAQYIR